MSASQPAYFNLQEFSDGGVPLVGGRLYTYTQGTTALKTAYTDPAGAIPQTYSADGLGGQYIALNARGELPAPLYLAPGAYDISLKRPDGTTVWTRRADPVVDNALSLSATTGASLVGFIQPETGAVARTLADKARDVKHIKDFGAICNGVSDDIVFWQAAIDSGVLVIDARGVTSKILGQLNLGSNQTVLLAGTTIVTGGAALKTFSAVTRTNFNLVGPFKIVGDLTVNPGSAVTACGIYIEDCSKWRIEDPTILDIKGYGIKLDPGASTTARSDHGIVNNPRIDNCVWGWHDRADQGSEYCTVNNIHVTRCYEAGIENSAGNTIFNGGHCVDNYKDGFRLQSGFNDGHGITIGMQINHNIQYNLVCTQVTNGHSFVGCHIYGAGGGVGAVYLDRCKGIILDGGHLDCWVYNDKDGSSGQNIIRNMYCPGGYGDIVLAPGVSAGSDQLWFSDCYGAGAYTSGVTINDPAPVYVLLRRVPGAYQALPGAANLIFPTEMVDRRLAYDNTTGVFTVPPGQGGIYRITANIICSGTAMSVTNSFIDLKVSGSSITIALPTIYGTTKLAFVVAPPEFALNAGDTMVLNATINGTTPVFGDGTWVSSLAIERIA